MQPTNRQPAQIDPERVRVLLSLYRTIKWSNRAIWIGLGGGAGCLTLWLAMGRTLELGLATGACFLGALIADMAYRRARKMWHGLCPCPGCEARRARERMERGK